jgi:hypothetical protein
MLELLGCGCHFCGSLAASKDVISLFSVGGRKFTTKEITLRSTPLRTSQVNISLCTEHCGYINYMKKSSVRLNKCRVRRVLMAGGRRRIFQQPSGNLLRSVRG